MGDLRVSFTKAEVLDLPQKENSFQSSVTSLSQERCDSTDSGISDPEDQSDEAKTFEIEVYLGKCSTHFVCGREQPKSCYQQYDKVKKTLTKAIEKVLSNQEKTFDGMVRQLGVSNVSDAKLCLKKVSDGMFSDGQYNWGRIVTLFAFSGALAKSLKSKQGCEDACNEIGKEVGRYIGSKMSRWILEQGGWDAMGDFFQEDTNSFWKGLLCTAISLGAIATTVMVMR